MKTAFKKFATLALSALAIASAFSFASCGDKQIEIAVPNDTTNEARALLLLEHNGYIKLKEDAGIAATPLDIVENPYNIKFREVEAAQIPRILQSVDYAIINSNYALTAKLNPVEDSLLIEDSYSAYGNILAVKSGNETSDKIKALYAALTSQTVKDYIAATYGGAVIGTVESPTNGFDVTVNYDALKNTTITVAASATPHAEILEQAKTVLKTKDITLDIRVFDDYVQPNIVVDSGELDANYFQHLPYLENFNKENKISIVSLGAIHVEPMGLYGGKQTTLDALKKSK